MGEVLPLRWLGRTRRARIEAALQPRIDTWARGWCRAQPQLASDDALQPDMDWSTASAGDGSIALGVAPCDWALLGAVLLGCPVDGAGPLAEAVAKRAVAELLEALSGSAATQNEGRSPAVLAPRAGGATFALEVSDVALSIHLDAKACADVVPAASATPRALVSRREAVAPLSAPLQVTLPLGHLPLEHLAQLKPGDVLRTSIRVGGLVQLAADDGTIARTGHLVADGDHRAIRIQ